LLGKGRQAWLNFYSYPARCLVSRQQQEGQRATGATNVEESAKRRSDESSEQHRIEAAAKAMPRLEQLYAPAQKRVARDLGFL
jgi:hypothetical protein